MYLKLFNAVTDALEHIDISPDTASAILRQAQLDCEELYISLEDE